MKHSVGPELTKIETCFDPNINVISMGVACGSACLYRDGCTTQPFYALVPVGRWDPWRHFNAV
nr:hypothetical protein Q903MT_gene5971 [Picea sitchensis]